MTKRRLGIILTEFGIPSEVWALRQAEAFEHFEPVYFGFSRRKEGLTLLEDRELYLFGTAQTPREQYFRRIQMRLGLAAGAAPAPSILRTMRQQLEAARLDAVLCHFAWNGVAVAAAVGKDLPIICHVHGRDVTANLRWPANRRALVRALPRFAHVVAVGAYQEKILKRLHPGAHVSVIPCGAPITLFATRPLPERTEGEPLVFITVGRVSPEKGQIQTLEAFEAVVAADVDARLVIVGDGPQMEELRARVAASSAQSRVRLAGMLPSARVADELAASHVFLQHSRPAGGWMEGAPVTLVEAGATGLPLIATDVGGSCDSVNTGQNGYLIQPDDVAAQTNAMLELAKNEDLRRRLGANARVIAQGLDSTAMARRLEAEILAVVGPAE